jgi:hypothetical protein
VTVTFPVYDGVEVAVACAVSTILGADKLSLCNETKFCPRVSETDMSAYVGVALGLPEAVAVAVGVNVGVAVALPVGVAVALPVAVAVGVAEGVAVFDAVGLAVEVGVETPLPVSFTLCLLLFD